MRIMICLFLLIDASLSFSQENAVKDGQVNKNNLPTPQEENQLFYLQRDPDDNTIIYAASLLNGELDPSNPIDAYWIRYEEDGKKQKLSFIQRKMAYGVNYKELSPNVYEMYIHAYKPLKIKLSKNSKTGKFEAHVKVKDMNILLNRIFVRINGGSLFKPNVQYIEICGKNMKDGKETVYRFDL